MFIIYNKLLISCNCYMLVLMCQSDGQITIIKEIYDKLLSDGIKDMEVTWRLNVQQSVQTDL